MNLATLWKLPLIMVCENNGFAEFTPRSAHTNVERVSDVVAPYEVERSTVDGNDVLAVWDGFGGYLASARAGGGPFLLECLTYRLGGHYEGDAAKYREAIADAEWQAKDPILRLQRYGLAQGWFDEAAIAAFETQAQAEVEQAVEFARASPFPELSLTEAMVYARA